MGETLFVPAPAVGEASRVDVPVGRVVSIGGVKMTAGGVSVGSGIAVGSITGAGVGAQAVKRINAATMNFFIEDNYMSVDVVASGG
jgi:hypothetical protein